MVDAAGAIGRAEAFRDDDFAAESAGVLEDGRTSPSKCLLEGDPVARAAEQIGEHGLASLDRLPPKVLAVEFDQVEGTEHGNMIAKPKTAPCVQPASSGDLLREPALGVVLWRKNKGDFQEIALRMIVSAPGLPVFGLAATRRSPQRHGAPHRALKKDPPVHPNRRWGKEAVQQLDDVDPDSS